MNHPEKLDLILDPELIRRYNVSGPRYTSYPTALQFSNFDQVQFENAILSSNNRNQSISLYIHIPFCANLCYYCACSKIVTKQKQPAIEYLALLKREISLLAPKLKNRTVSQLHWGGGTPTYFTDEQISELMHALKQAFGFQTDEEGEFSIEIDPRTVDSDRIAHLRRVGFNRLSFGIQDFNPQVQKAVNRIQSFEQTKVIVDAAYANNFKSVSVDLIYGLPHQTVASFTETLDQINTLSPDRISIYNYAHMPDKFFPQTRILATDLPTPSEKLDILQLCIEKLCAETYVYIGMDHFAKPTDELAKAQINGTLQRNFQGYSTQADCDLIALGVTGISHVGNTFSQNVKEIDSYKRHLENNILPIEKGVVIDKDDQIRKEVIKSLICQFALNYQTINTIFNIDFKQYFAAEIEALEKMITDGLLTIDANGIHVTPQGRLLIRNICMVFDRYIQSKEINGNRFSKAI